MKKILLLIVSILFTTISGCAQQKKMKIEDVDEIWIYAQRDSLGYTTAGVARRFLELEENNITKYKLEPFFVDSLKNMLFYSSKSRRVFQEKTGQNLIFSQFVMKDGSTRNIIINSVGIVDYFVGNTASYFKDDKNQKDQTLWRNNFFNKISIKINKNNDPEN